MSYRQWAVIGGLAFFALYILIFWGMDGSLSLLLNSHSEDAVVVSCKSKSFRNVRTSRRYGRSVGSGISYSPLAVSKSGQIVIGSKYIRKDWCNKYIGYSVKAFISNRDPKKNRINSLFQFWLEPAFIAFFILVFIIPLPMAIKQVIAAGFALLFLHSWLSWQGWLGGPDVTDDERSKLAFEQCIKDALTRQKITDRSQLKELICYERSLTYLSGLDELTGLEKLSITSNKLTSLEGLSSLKKLKILHVSFNRDLTSLKGLETAQNLSVLDARETSLQDISALTHLKNLTKVDFYRTKVSSLKALKNHNGLREIFAGSKIQSLEGMEDKPQLEKIYFYSSSVKDISPLFGNKNLKAVGVDSKWKKVPCEQVFQMRKILSKEAKVIAKYCD